MKRPLQHLFGRKRERLIEPGDWPERTSRPRVLVENPDGADLWAHAEVLRGAGYDVAVCAGPTEEAEHVPRFRRHRLYFDDFEPIESNDERLLCPLLVQGRCHLVEGADVVVSTTALPESREILAAHSAKGSPALVVEGQRPALERDSDVTGGATVIEHPVTEQRLLAAVEHALSERPS